MKNVVLDCSLVDGLSEMVAACIDPKSLRALEQRKLPAKARAKLNRLAEKANEGLLTSKERAEYLDYMQIRAFFAIVQSKARIRLKMFRGAKPKS